MLTTVALLGIIVDDSEMGGLKVAGIWMRGNGHSYQFIDNDIRAAYNAARGAAFDLGLLPMNTKAIGAIFSEKE